MNLPSVWDNLASRFHTHDPDAMSPSVADNVILAEPVLVKGIQMARYAADSSRILDFGCGTGGFVRRLKKLGFLRISGVDSSPAMIQGARDADSDGVYIEGSLEEVEGTFDIITAMMSIQFIPDQTLTIALLCTKLARGGSIFFAVFNKEYILHHLLKTTIFRTHQSHSYLTEATLDFGESNSATVYVRDEEFYDSAFRENGMSRILLERPPFTDEFVAAYGKGAGMPSEYLILGYRKQ